MKLYIPLLLLAVLAVPLRAESPATQPAVTPIKPPTRTTDFLTQDQLVQAFRARQFELVIHETVRIEKTPAVLVNFRRFDLLVLRAESYLQSHNYVVARQTFEQAATFAPDDDRRCVMLATAALAQKQVGGKYYSRTSGPDGTLLATGPTTASRRTAIDILDLTRRNAALRGLCNDMVAEMQNTLSHPPSDDAIFRALERVAVTERAATGGLDRTHKFQLEVGEAMGLELNRKIEAGARTLKGISRRQHVENPVAGEGTLPQTPAMVIGTPPRGSPYTIASDNADPPNVQQINNLLTMTDGIPQTTKELASRLHLDPNFYQKVVDAAATLHESAEEALIETITTP